MLEILRLKSPESKRELFQLMNPAQDSWIVSDLQSKWQLQKELLAKSGVLEQAAVQRASELWKKLALQVMPEVRLLSPELAQTLFWNWIEPMELEWARSPHAVPVVINQMQMWMSIFSDPNHADILSQWFTDNQESYVRWGHWFELCKEIWSRCHDENLLMVSWLPAVLLSKDLSNLHIKKSLTFDLGPQVTQVEGQLIKELSKHHSVRVLYPEAPWLGLMKNTLRPYELLTDQASPANLEWQPDVQKTVSFGRFSTQLAEVKDAVATVHRWLIEGVKPQDIAIVAPDIEEYWPSLKMYLEEEGIPVAKSVSVKLGGFLEIAKWLSSLRTAMAKVSSGDLEVFIFSSQPQPAISYDDFRVLFSQVYDAGDLSRARQLFESQQALPREPIMIRDYLAWSLKFWDRDVEPQRLMALLKVIGEEVPERLELLPSQWLSYIEGLVARRDVSLSAADESGIWCVSLSSADWLPATHGLFLNLNENSLRSVDVSPVSQAEGQRIFTDTGFAVGTNDRQEHEFEFLWFLKRRWTDLHLCFANTDFQGRVLTPSRLWIWAGFVSDQLKLHSQSPGRTRWDEIQALPLERISELRAQPQEQSQGLSRGLQRDRGQGASSWDKSQSERLSASALEKYWDCAFVYAAERKLRQSDDPVLDLDLDRRGRGNLLHALVEELCTEPFRKEWTEAELESLVDQCREKEHIRTGEERLWPAIRAQHVKLGRKFLRFEAEWRERFPMTKTVGREVPFEVFFDPHTSTFSKAPGAIRIAGRLDRVDVDSQGRYAVIDYKGSAASTTNWKSWLPNHKIQMALYTYLLESGFTSLPAGAVVAANFFVVKDEDRRKGFFVKEEGAELYSVEDKHRNFISQQEKAELFENLCTLLREATLEIISGQLDPLPADLKICASCTWRSLCRATHLN